MPPTRRIHGSGCWFIFWGNPLDIEMLYWSFLVLEVMFFFLQLIDVDVCTCVFTLQWIKCLTSLTLKFAFVYWKVIFQLPTGRKGRTVHFQPLEVGCKVGQTKAKFNVDTRPISSLYITHLYIICAYMSWSEHILEKTCPGTWNWYLHLYTVLVSWK